MSLKIVDLHIPRDIEYGFIGRVDNRAYDQRRQFLERSESELGVQLLRTQPGEEYNRMLNRIKVFISADIGLGEYMCKNFEAMAAGCLLCCYRQGNGEEESLGFVDMHNVVLYTDFVELQSKLQRLRGAPEQLAEIAKRGQRHVQIHFNLAALAKKQSTRCRHLSINSAI